MNINGQKRMGKRIKTTHQDTYSKPLKRIRLDNDNYINPNKIEEETTKINSNYKPPEYSLLSKQDSFYERSTNLRKRNKIRSEDSDSMVFEQEYINNKKNKKLGEDPEPIMGFDYSNDNQEGLELDQEKMKEFHDSQNKKPIPAIKMSLRIFETVPKTFYKNYDCINEIGKGAYGTVYKGIHNITKQFVAIKRIFLRNKVDDFNELNILKEASHPNIITPLEYCVYDNNIYIVSEFCEGGSLFERILKKKSLDEDTCKNIMISMLSALNYCHNIKGIVHRDIKPENMVFVDNDSEDNIKLIDFGLSKVLKDSEYLNKKCGSAFYLAPEVLKGSYNHKCDIWSLGVVLFIILTGRPLVYGKNQSQILAKIYGLKSVTNLVRASLKCFPEVLVDFILNMLKVNPSERWGAKELLGHEWLAQAISQSQGKTSQEKLEQTMSKQIYLYYRL